MSNTFSHIEVTLGWSDGEIDQKRISDLKKALKAVVGFSTPEIIDEQPETLNYYPGQLLSLEPKKINADTLRNALNQIGEKYGFTVLSAIKANNPPIEQLN